jgi:hypothetical protein
MSLRRVRQNAVMRCIQFVVWYHTERNSHIFNVRNTRLDTIRGGSLKTEEGTGIVNIVACTFKDNFSFMGGAVYVRNKFTNIVDSVFINNTSTVSKSRKTRYFHYRFLQKFALNLRTLLIVCRHR